MPTLKHLSIVIWLSNNNYLWVSSISSCLISAFVWNNLFKDVYKANDLGIDRITHKGRGKICLVPNITKIMSPFGATFGQVC